MYPCNDEITEQSPAGPIKVKLCFIPFVDSPLWIFRGVGEGLLSGNCMTTYFLGTSLWPLLYSCLCRDL